MAIEVVAQQLWGQNRTEVNAQKCDEQQDSKDNDPNSEKIL
jgi:hypothetical protein